MLAHPTTLMRRGASAMYLNNKYTNTYNSIVNRASYTAEKEDQELLKEILTTAGRTL